MKVLRNSFNDLLENKSTRFYIHSLFGFGLIGVFLVIILPLLLSQLDWFFDYTETGQIGDTIGGIAGPWIAIIAALLTFYAFLMQFVANRMQASHLKSQEFENLFFQFLGFHKSNVSEFRIGKGINTVYARRSFVKMFEELRYTYYVVENFYNNKFDSEAKVIEKKDLLFLSYTFFYMGVGQNSDKLSQAIVKKHSNPNLLELFNAVNKELEILKGTDSPKRPVFHDEEENPVSMNLGYTPWDGHQSRLAHYFRNLMELSRLVANRKELSEEDKQKYFRVLRAQLTDYEQLLIYYNAISGFGRAWIKDHKSSNVNYFTKFKLIHNLPVPLANFAIKPMEFLDQYEGSKEEVFDWVENN